MPIKHNNGILPFKKDYRMFVINPFLESAIPSDVLAHWKFDNNINDSGPNGYNLTANNAGGGYSFQNDRKGNANSCVLFNNTGASYTNLLIPIVKEPVNTGFTISFWVKATAWGVVITLNPGAGTQFWISFPWWTLKDMVYRHVGNYMLSGNMNNYGGWGVWMHHVMTFSQSYVLNYYINNINTIVNQQFASSFTFKLGHFGWGNGGYPCTAALDDVRIYERVLTLAEIALLYAE